MIFQTQQVGAQAPLQTPVDAIVIVSGALSDSYGGGVPTNDVWLSTNYTLSWQQVAVDPFSPRMDAALAVSSNGIIAMYGGNYETYAGDWDNVEQAVWVSPDVGTTWMQVKTFNAPLISEVALVFDSLGFLYMFGGEFGPYENWAQSGYKLGLSVLTISSWWPTANLHAASQAAYAWPASITDAFAACAPPLVALLSSSSSTGRASPTPALTPSPSASATSTPTLAPTSAPSSAPTSIPTSAPALAPTSASVTVAATSAAFPLTSSPAPASATSPATSLGAAAAVSSSSSSSTAPSSVLPPPLPAPAVVVVVV